MPALSLPIARAAMPGRPRAPSLAGPRAARNRSAPPRATGARPVRAPRAPGSDAGGRPVRGVPVALAVALALRPLGAAADHGAPATPVGGIGWTTWLLVAGAVLAAALAAWAFLAPGRPEPPVDDALRRPPEPRA